MERPSQRWSRTAATQAAAVAAGTLAPEDAYATALWPAEFTAAVDAVLERYEQEVRGVTTSADEELWAAVEHVVRALNGVNDEHGFIETGERESLCDYIDAVLTGADVDVPALTARRGIDRWELTDTWRDW